jgi:prepilin peptidase CpaA
VAYTLPIPTIVVLLAVGVAAITDVWKFKVHNLLTIPLLLSGLVYHGIAGGWEGFMGSVLSSLCGFAILIAFYVLGGMGAGDVKLLAALGAWLGVPLTVYLFLVSALAAGVYALALILIYGRPGETWRNLQIVCYRLTSFFRYLGSEDRVEAEVKDPCRRRRVIPFAAMMGLGLLTLLVWHWLQGSK